MEEEDQPVPSQQGPSQKGQEKGTKGAPKYPCLRCRKNVAKTSKSVRCRICQYWVHTECEGMSNEMYNLMANPEKYGAVGLSWTCVSCMASAAKIEEVVGRYENRIKEVETRVSSTESSVTELGRKVDKINEELRARDDKIEQRQQKSLKN